MPSAVITEKYKPTTKACLLLLLLSVCRNDEHVHTSKNADVSLCRLSDFCFFPFCSPVSPWWGTVVRYVFTAWCDVM